MLGKLIIIFHFCPLFTMINPRRVIAENVNYKKYKQKLWDMIGGYMFLSLTIIMLKKFF